MKAVLQRCWYWVRRIPPGVAWRWVVYYEWYRGWLSSKGATFYINARWPWPLRKPWQRERLRLYTYVGVGDQLMATPVFREIKRLNPACEITFVAQNPELLEGNPHVDHLEKMEKGRNDTGIRLEYTCRLPPPRPLISLMGESVGLKLSSVDLEIAREERARPELIAEIEALPRPRVVIQPLPSVWIPVKKWPEDRWRQLVGMLVRRFQVIELGTETFLDPREFGAGFTSLVGRTPIEEMIAVIRRCDVVVGPPSGGMHIARAVHLPSVIIFGGFESPSGIPYPDVTAFYREVECAPCWLLNKQQCPHEMKCMKLISPEEVYEAIVKAVETRMSE